jgi:hypothetical protein
MRCYESRAARLRRYPSRKPPFAEPRDVMADVIFRASIVVNIDRTARVKPRLDFADVLDKCQAG